MMSESAEEPFPEPEIPALGVWGGHQVQATRHETNQYGRFAKAWQCVSCGKESTSLRVFENNPCQEPVLWVQVGCPGDGLRVCRDCDIVYIGDYSRTDKIAESTCVNCGSLEVYRDDDPDVDPGDVQPSYGWKYTPVLTDNGGAD